MKKLLLLIIALVFMLNLAACSAEAPTENSDGKPPAFTVIERRLKLTKQSKKGESATFSADDFSNLLGENLTYITVSALPDAKEIAISEVDQRGGKACDLTRILANDVIKV